MNAPLTYRKYIRPSFLPVLAACPAAAQLTFYVVERFGEPPTEEAADLGSDIHAAVMLILLPLAKVLPADGSACAIGFDDHALAERFPGLSGWDRACVRRCVEFAVALVNKTRNDYPGEPVEVMLEQHLDGSVLGIERGGTADLIIVVPFRIVRVVDWKAGFLDQGEAADHDSLAAYGVMAAATFKTQRIDVFLFQPRAEMASRASGARFAASELKASEVWTRDVVAAATEDNPEAIAGLHCTKCRALHRCPAAREYLMRAIDAFSLIADPKDPRAWGDIIAAAKVATKFGKDVQDLAKGHLVAGGTADGWKLQPSGKQREIDAKLAVKLAQDAGVLHLLLEFASFKASAADAVEAIGPAVSEKQKAPSLAAIKSATANA